MAKKEAIADRVPGLSDSSQRSVQQIMRLLEESRSVTYMHTYEHFSRTLDIWLAVLHQIPMRPWLKTCAGMELGLAPLSKALGILMLEAQNNYHDLLGSIYMMLSQGEKRLGQYFTPFDVAKMMARMLIGEIKPLEPGQRPEMFREPCCGSGVMILAYAEAVEEQCPGAILRGEIQFCGIDLDQICVRMTQLNMFLHQIGIVKLEESVSKEEYAAARAAGRPVAALFQPARIIQGNTLDPDTEKQFRDESLFPWYPINLFTVLSQPPAFQESEEGERQTEPEVVELQTSHDTEQVLPEEEQAVLSEALTQGDEASEIDGTSSGEPVLEGSAGQIPDPDSENEDPVEEALQEVELQTGKGPLLENEPSGSFASASSDVIAESEPPPALFPDRKKGLKVDPSVVQPSLFSSLS